MKTGERFHKKNILEKEPQTMSAQFLKEVKMEQSQVEVASTFQLLNPNT